jgi:hypothetical protein
VIILRIKGEGVVVGGSNLDIIAKLFVKGINRLNGKFRDVIKYLNQNTELNSGPKEITQPK